MSCTFKAAFSSLTAVVLLGLLANLAQAAPTLWNGGGDNTNWSDPNNWTAGVPTASSDVQFDNAAAANNSHSMMNLGNVSIASYEQSKLGGTHQFNLGTSALTTGSLSLAVLYGTTDKNGSAYLTVDGSAGSLLKVTGKLSMSQGRGRTASLTINPDVTLQIGSNPSSRGELSLIESTSASHATNTATLTAGKTFNAYLTNLTVGAEITGFDGDKNNSVGTLNLANVTSGVLDVSDNFLVGEGFGATGIVDISDAVNVKVGVNNGHRGILNVASGDSKQEAHLASNLTFGTGSLKAYLTELNVAHATRISTYAGADDYSATGTLDASEISGGFIDVAGPVRVGTNEVGNGNTAVGVYFTNDPNYSPRGIGTLKLSAIDVSAYTLQVGDAANVILRNGTQGNKGRGTLELTGTRFEVRDSVIIDGFDAANSGLVTIEVEDQAAGLILGAGASLTVGEGLIDITFLTPEDEFEGDFFGLSWEGNHVGDLLTLGSKLTWDDTALTGAGFDAASIYYRAGTTYVGMYIQHVPEPATGLLLGIGVMLMMKRRRHR